MEKKLKQEIKPSLKHRFLPSLRVKIAYEFSLKEQELINKLLELETTQEFQKLVELGLVRRVKYISSKFSVRPIYEYTDDLNITQIEDIDLIELKEQKQNIFGLIKQIGEENYKKFFLGFDTYSFDYISKELGISVDEVKMIFDFTNNVFIQSEFYLSQRVPYNSDKIAKKYTTLAKVDISKNGEFEVVYLSASISRGKYEISYDKLKDAFKNFSASEMKKIKNVLKEIELINLRNTTIHKILEFIITFQKKFIITEDYEDLKICTKNQLAKELNLHPSSVCRLIKDKSIILPSTKEYPLEFLLPNRKKIMLFYLADLLFEKQNLKDKDLIELIKKRFNILLNRRTVNYYKNLAKKMLK